MSDIPMDERFLLSVPQAAVMIDRGITFIYEAIADGRIQAVKSDKRTLVKVESLREFANSLPPAKIKLMSRKRRRQLTQAEVRAA
jgi:hypothetical protein